MERDLLQQLKEGNTRALKELYESFFPLLLAEAREMGLPMKSAAGAINQIFLEFWQKEGKFDGGDSLSFFQEKIKEYQGVGGAEGTDKGWLRKGVKKFSKEEQELLRHCILNGNTLPVSAKKFNLSEEELASRLSGILIQLAEMDEDLSKAEAYALSMAFVPEPKYRKLVIRYLNEEVSIQEEHELRHWVDLEDKHSHYFEQMYEVWEALKALPEARPPKLEDSWKQLERELSQTPLGQRKKKILGRFSLRLALAVLLLIILLSAIGYWVGRDGNSSLQDLPEADLQLLGDTFVRPNSKEASPLIPPFALIERGVDSPDTLFIQENGKLLMLSTTGIPLLIRNPSEQLLLSPGEELGYDPAEELFVNP